jgi:hypothetical protein
MKRLLTLSILLLVCLILTPTVSYAGGPWGKTIRGAGTLSYEQSVLSQTIGVESHIVWNVKVNTESGEINGHVSIFEKLEDGTTRHFRLSSDQMQTEGNPEELPTYFCELDGQKIRSVRVVGVTDKETIAVLFDEQAKTVDYEVSYAPTNPNDDSATRIGTGGPADLEGHMYLDCGEESQVGQQGRKADSSKIFLPIVLSGFGH